MGLSFEIPLLCIILTVDSSQASRVLPIQLQKTTFNAIAAISWLQSEFWRVRTDIWDIGRGYWNDSSFIAHHNRFLTCSHVLSLFDWVCFHFGLLAYFSTTLVPFYLALWWHLGERRLPLGHRASALLSHLSPVRRGLTSVFSLPGGISEVQAEVCPEEGGSKEKY